MAQLLNTTITGTLGATGAVAFGTTLAVIGAVTFGSTLGVTGAITGASFNGVAVAAGANTFTVTVGTASLTVPPGVSGTLGSAAFTSAGAYQAASAALASIAGLTTTADRGIYATGANAYAVFIFTAAGRALLDDADAAAQRVTLNLGNVENTALSTWAGSSNITALGTIVSGTFPYANLTGAPTGALLFKGVIDCSANPDYPGPTIKAGWTYKASVAGRIGGAGGVVVSVGDLIIATADNDGGAQGAVGTSWTVQESNIPGITAAGLAILQAADAAAQRTALALGGVNNTADADKPVSTAQAAADTAVANAAAANALAKAAVIQVSNATARKTAGTYAGLGVMPFVGMKVLEAGIREVTQITCLGSVAGVAEVTGITCLGSTYNAAVAEITEIECRADAGGDLNGTDSYLYRQSDGLPVVIWFNVDAGGVAPDWGAEGVEAHYIAVPISTNAAAPVVAEALRTALSADAAFHATRSGTTVTVTHATAGNVDDGGDDSAGMGVTVTTQGANARRGLEGRTFALRVPGATLTVGYSEAGNVGDIPVTLVAATTMSANAIAALTQAAIHNAHVAANATVLAAVVTVTNVNQGAVTDASAGSTGFGVNVTTQGTNHALEGKTLTLKALNRTVTVGYSVTGIVGDIAITLPADTRTDAQIATLTQTAVEAHASFGAAVAGTVVTVTNTLAAAVSGAGAGTTGFTLAVLTAGIDRTGNLFILLATAALATDAGWLAIAADENVIGPAFTARYTGGNFNLQPGVFTKIVMPTVDLDTHGCYDPGTGRFTPSKAGDYLFILSGRVAIAGITTGVSLTVFKNGAEVQARAAQFCGLGSAAIQVAGVKKMTANGTTDYFEYYIRQDDGSPRPFRGGPAENIFQAFFLPQ